MTYRHKHPDNHNEILIETAAIAFQIERDNIQTMFETDRISREKAKELRNNIALLEISLNWDKAHSMPIVRSLLRKMRGAREYLYNLGRNP